MYKFLLYLLLISGFSVPSFSQDKVLLRDDFNNNKNKWDLQDNSRFVVDIKNGALHLEKLEKNFTSRGCLWYSKTIDGFNTLDNFSITYYARFISGGDIFEMMDFQWGYKGPVVDRQVKSNLYQLNFFLNGDVRLDCFNSSWKNFTRKSIKTSLGDEFDPHHINKYDIIQKDGIIIFSINDKEVFKQFCTPIAGNTIGFQQCLKSAWEIDKIIIRQAVAKKATAPDSTVITSNNSQPVTYPADNELKVYPNPFTNSISVKIYLEKEESIQLDLVDMTGTVLQQYTGKLQKGVQRILLYADVLPGSYTLRMYRGKEKPISATIIKQ